MFTYETIQKANNIGADQTARMRRLVCACVVRKPPETGFLAMRPIYGSYQKNHEYIWFRGFNQNSFQDKAFYDISIIIISKNIDKSHEWLVRSCRDKILVVLCTPVGQT